MTPETINTIEQITAAVILAIPAGFSLLFLADLVRMKTGRDRK